MTELTQLQKKKLLNCSCKNYKVKSKMTYEMGFKNGSAKKGDFNYDKELWIPFNSFSHPKTQAKDYKCGWIAGRRKR